MPSKNTTTVVLTELAQRVKDDLAPIFGLKNILSGALVLFGKLSDSDQKAAIAEANTPQTDKAKPEEMDVQKSIENVKYFVQYKLLSKKERLELEALLKALEAEKPKMKRKSS